MTLHIHPLDPTVPSDHSYLLPMSRIHLAAWLTVPLMRAIYFSDEEDARKGYVASMLERDRRAFIEDPKCRFAVVLDDEVEEDEGEEAEGKEKVIIGGKVIAAIKYYFFDGPPASPAPVSTSTSSVSQPLQDSSPIPFPPQTHTPLAQDFRGHLLSARADLTAHLGPHILIDNLYTDPSQHRRGAGSMLMRHACAVADAHNLPAMLEASPVGVGVYASVGFEKITWDGMDGKGGLWVDLQRWEDGLDKGIEFTETRIREGGGEMGNGDGWYLQVLMIRPAKKAGGGEKKECRTSA